MSSGLCAWKEAGKKPIQEEEEKDPSSVGLVAEQHYVFMEPLYHYGEALVRSLGRRQTPRSHIDVRSMVSSGEPLPRLQLMATIYLSSVGPLSWLRGSTLSSLKSKKRSRPSLYWNTLHSTRSRHLSRDETLWLYLLKLSRLWSWARMLVPSMVPPPQSVGNLLGPSG